MEEVFYSKCTEFNVNIILKNKNKIFQLYSYSYDQYLNKHLDNILLTNSTHLINSDVLNFETVGHTLPCLVNDMESWAVTAETGMQNSDSQMRVSALFTAM